MHRSGKVRHLSRSTASHHGNSHCGGHTLDEGNVVSLLGAIPIHRSEKNFPRAACFHLLGLGHRIHISDLLPSVGAHPVRTPEIFFDIQGNDDGGAPIFPGGLPHKGRVLEGRRIQHHLLHAESKQRGNIFQGADASPVGKGHKTFPCHVFHQIKPRASPFSRGGDIQKHQFVALFFVKNPHRVQWIADVGVVGKLHALVQSIPSQQQTGDHPRPDHLPTPSQKFRSRRMPNRRLFSG